MDELKVGEMFFLPENSFIRPVQLTERSLSATKEGRGPIITRETLPDTLNFGFGRR